MIDLSVWMPQFLQVLSETFGDRVWFVGLQGSYGRGEATETSDLDMVVILDTLSAPDILAYRAMLDSLPHRDLLCGFLAGKAELFHWELSDLFQFCHDTTPVRGSLEDVMARIDRDAVRRAIQTGACNLYHGCVHNMVHAKSERHLKGLYKAASFVVQAIHFLQTGTYLRLQTDLLQAVSPEERAILETFLALKQGAAVDFQAMSEALFVWAGHWIQESE